ncbi:hypothetical protein ACIRRA_05900 [Nocardia sp. NPDC101769]|uniref:hypothetical protein n=1 Tax=Nocardia sp. NPDC101769 TaxID=3364333 RepID=UPI003813A8E5
MIVVDSDGVDAGYLAVVASFPSADPEARPDHITVTSKQIVPQQDSEPTSAIVRSSRVSAAAGRVTEMATAVAAAHIAALDAQHALLGLALADLERDRASGRVVVDAPPAAPVCTSVVPADPFAPFAFVQDTLVDDRTRSLIAEFRWPHDDRAAVNGRVSPLMILESSLRTIDSVREWMIGDPEAALRWDARPVEFESRFRDRMPLAGATLRFELRIARGTRDNRHATAEFSGRWLSGNAPFLEISSGRMQYGESGVVPPPTVPVSQPRSPRGRRGKGFKPLEHTEIRTLSHHALHRLAHGDIVDVYGGRWDQRMPGANPGIRIAPAESLLITGVSTIDPRAGVCGFGTLTGTQIIPDRAWYCTSDDSGVPMVDRGLLVEAGYQLLRTYAVHLGLHLAFPDAEFQPAPEIPASIQLIRPLSVRDESARYRVEVTEITMVPRPTVVADVQVRTGGEPVAILRNLAIEIREQPGAAFRPELRADGPVFLGRYGSQGDPAWLNEFHLGHMENGEPAIALGQVLDGYSGRTMLYIPNGEFRFVDRIQSLVPAGPQMRDGRTVTEYDVPPRSWYYEDNAFEGLPGSILMESSLQAAALSGACMGTTAMVAPEVKLSVRNLDGTATVLADLDVRGATLRQETTLVSTMQIAGQVLQRFQYTVTADGVPYYEGNSLFGYFTPEALASQIGLDGGASVPRWIDTVDRADLADVIDIDYHDRPSWSDPRPDDGLHIGSGHFALIDRATIVKSGGLHGLGYLAGTRRVDPADWYFECHFHTDPVMPGSLGVEAVMQGLQTFVIVADLAAGMGPVRFALATDVPFTWTYRGQILRTEKQMDFELHITDIRCTGNGLRVIADANVFKPGMRIYAFRDIAVDVRPERQLEGKP